MIATFVSSQTPLHSPELWLPEVRIENLVTLERLELREGQGELRVRGDKTINLIHRLRVKIGCQMELRMFPHDQQVRRMYALCISQ